MADPNGTGGLSVTLKADGNNGTWIVFHGAVERIREDITTAFTLPDTSKDWSFHEIVLEATRIYKGQGNASRVLGATPASSGGSSPAWEEARSGAPAAPAEPEVDPLFGRIENSTTADELKELYARNAKAFGGNAELVTAWKAKGKSLKEAAK